MSRKLKYQSVTQAVAAYRADIEIGVRGVRYLDELQNKLTQVSKTIEQVNKQQVVIRRTIAGAASATPMGPGGSGVTGASAQAAAFAVEKRVSEMRRADAQAQLKSLKDRSYAENYISGIINRRLQIKQQELAAEQKITAEKQKQAAATLRSRVGSAASNAVIGGAFPLLFGQGAGAAVGGGLGGAVGGAFGGTLGFGLSLVGTAIGQAVDDAAKLKQELNSLNNSLSSTGGTSRTTASDISQLASQLGIAKDEALKLVAAFSEFGSANIREALATSFGAVGGEEAFNALAAAIDNKSTLEAIVKLRDVITDSQAKEALKQLEINGSVTANTFLQQRLVALQEEKLMKVAKEITLMDRLLAAAAALGAQGQFIDPATFGQERVAQIQKGAAARKKAQDQALADTRKFLSEVARLNEQFSTKEKTGRKPPEDRTTALQADLQALIEMGNAEDLIRDLRFQGRELLIPEVELTKKLSDIARDRTQALRQANYESEKLAISQIAQTRATFAQKEIEDQIRDIKQKRFEQDLRDQEAVRNAVRSFTDLREEQLLQVQYGKTYLRLVTEGMLPAEATRLANFEKLVTQQLSAVKEQIRITELAILEAKARGASTVELEKQLKVFKDQQDAIKGEAAKGPGEGPKPGDTIKTAVAAARGELNELLNLEKQVVAAAAAIGDAFSQAFQGLVTGAMTGQEALAAFFKGVGDHFLDMASKMIAKLIEIYILETVLGFITGAAGAGGGAPRGTPGAVAPNGAAYFGPAFAEGGFVTGPTKALIGEGGEPEYVIPASKMRTAMGRYSAGARGSSVVSGTGKNSSESGVSTATMEPIDVRYSIERINNVDYVTADQFQRGMAQAAQQGAIQGERRAMQTLQNSPATRRRVSV